MSDDEGPEETGGDEALHSITEDMHAIFERITQVARNEESSELVKTGFPNLDHLLGGLVAGDLAVIGGRPGSGKTALCFEVLRRCGLWNADDSEREPSEVLFVAAGERSQTLTERFLASTADVPVCRVRRARMVEDEFRAFVGAADRAHHSRIRFLDGLYPSVSAVTAAMRGLQGRVVELRDENGTSSYVEPPLVFIDSIQQLAPLRERSNRHQELTDTVREIRKAADDAGCVVIATSPVNRFHRTREHPWPVLSDLRESGALEDEADFVLFIDREPREEDALPPDANRDCWLIVAKNRNGLRARIPLWMNASGKISDTAFEKGDE